MGKTYSSEAVRYGYDAPTLAKYCYCNRDMAIKASNYQKTPCQWFPWHNHPYSLLILFPSTNQSLLTYQLIIFYLQALYITLSIHLTKISDIVARHQSAHQFMAGRNLQDLGSGSPARNDRNILKALLG